MDDSLHTAVCVTCILSGTGGRRPSRVPLPAAPGCPRETAAAAPARLRLPVG